MPMMPLAMDSWKQFLSLAFQNIYSNVSAQSLRLSLHSVVLYCVIRSWIYWLCNAPGPRPVAVISFLLLGFSLPILFSFFDFDLWIGSSFVCAKNSKSNSNKNSNCKNNNISSSVPKVCSCSKICAGGCNQPFIVNDITHRISWVLSLFSLLVFFQFFPLFCFALCWFWQKVCPCTGPRCIGLKKYATTAEETSRITWQRTCGQKGRV